MYATIAQFMRMTPAEQARVTHLDLSIAGPEDHYRARAPEWPTLPPVKPGKLFKVTDEEAERRHTYGKDSQ
jgi:hypothetical protein